jgi:hypothetical protein
MYFFLLFGTMQLALEKACVILTCLQWICFGDSLIFELSADHGHNWLYSLITCAGKYQWEPTSACNFAISVGKRHCSPPFGRAVQRSESLSLREIIVDHGHDWLYSLITRVGKHQWEPTSG